LRCGRSSEVRSDDDRQDSNYGHCGYCWYKAAKKDDEVAPTH